MPQEHYVLRCFSCGSFQFNTLNVQLLENVCEKPRKYKLPTKVTVIWPTSVAHIVKKTKKWECKMCGAKQSVKRNYGMGSGKDCWNHVMKLNKLRFTNECSFNETGKSDDDLILPQLKLFDPNKPFSSKWEKYIDKPVTEPENEVDDDTDFSVEVKEKKKKRVIKTPENYSNKSKKVCCSSTRNCLLSPISDQKNFKSFKTEKNISEKDSPVQSKNEYENDIICGNDDSDFKASRNDEIRAKKSLNVFDSELTDLNEILSFE